LTFTPWTTAKYIPFGEITEMPVYLMGIEKFIFFYNLNFKVIIQNSEIKNNYLK
jgi:hypothetical protein